MYEAVVFGASNHRQVVIFSRLTFGNWDCFRRQTFPSKVLIYVIGIHCMCAGVCMRERVCFVELQRFNTSRQFLFFISSHKVSNLNFFIYILLFINSISVYTTFPCSCRLAAFFFHSGCVYCYRKFIFLLLLPLNVSLWIVSVSVLWFEECAHDIESARLNHHGTRDTENRIGNAWATCLMYNIVNNIIWLCCLLSFRLCALNILFGSFFPLSFPNIFIRFFCLLRSLYFRCTM